MTVMQIRHWDTFFDGRRSHLFIQKIKQEQGGLFVGVTWC